MTMTTLSNKDFVQAVFGEDAPYCHVTDFVYPPDEIPAHFHLKAWKGDYFKNYQFNAQPSNQYFTISTFGADEKGIARRRKALFNKTHCIVLDDVKEKLIQEEVDKLPTPSWILLSSAGSEQWGYILDKPCTDRTQVENLLDGLVEKGLAPEGKDPGMKGVTRYVRLPEGVNNKKKRLVDGHPFTCVITSWNPFNRVTMQEMAAPFNVNLDAVRRESRVDGAANVEGHPVLEVTDLVHVKEVRSEGRFDITCPWVDEHTGQDDSGSAIFTNKDGTIGFKCHHGNCQEKTGKNLLDFIEEQKPGFRAELKTWQMWREFGPVVSEEVVVAEPPIAVPSFLEAGEPVVTVSDSLAVPTAEPASISFTNPFDLYLKTPHDDPGFAELTEKVLKFYDSDGPVLDRVKVHQQIATDLGLNKAEFKETLTRMRKQWYEQETTDKTFYSELVFIGSLNKLYNRKKKIFYTPDAFKNSFAHVADNPVKDATVDGMVEKVDMLDFAPNKPPIFDEDGIRYANSWVANTIALGQEGDAGPWLAHFDAMGWGGEKRKHILQWMAHTILHPEVKINHMLILGGHEGSGKDFLLAPLTEAMRSQYEVISGDELLSSFNEYLMSTKYLHINECEMSDKRDAETVAKKIKPLAAAPPLKLSVNQKGISAINVRNILSLSMTTNDIMPLRVNGPSRRMYGLWSDLRVKDRRGSTKPEWAKYWKDMWFWMDHGGAAACIWYLRNCVDLSDFEPGAAPPMTDYMRDMTEASVNPVTRSIENLMEAKYGDFSKDLISAKDIVKTLKFAASNNKELVTCYTDSLDVAKVKMLMKKDNMMPSWVTPHGIIYCVRDEHKYNGLSQIEIANLYNPADLVPEQKVALMFKDAPKA